MGSWNDLLDISIEYKPRQVAVITGEVSSLVLDAVNTGTSKYPMCIRVTNAEHIATSLSLSIPTAYVVVDPTNDVLQTIEVVLREGTSDSFFIMFNGNVPDNAKDSVKYIKSKAQASKLYFNISPPKTDNARVKMEQVFAKRWAVPRDTAHQVCSILEYSPGSMYQFDKQFLLVTGGSILPSTKTKRLVDELLGSDTPNLVVSHIVNGKHIDDMFDDDFTRRVLNFLHVTINRSRLIQSAMLNGVTSPSAIAKVTGIPAFSVLQSIGFANTYQGDSLRACEDLVIWGLSNYQGNPEMLSVMSRVWR